MQQSSVGLRQNWGVGYQPIINEVIPEYPDLEQRQIRHRNRPSGLQDHHHNDSSVVPDSQDSNDYRGQMREHYVDEIQIEEEEEEAPPAKAGGKSMGTE